MLTKVHMYSILNYKWSNMKLLEKQQMIIILHKAMSNQTGKML